VSAKAGRGASRAVLPFVLATPTNAESLRLSWCDLQLAFLPRDPGRAYSPPIRLLSRLGVGDLEERVPDRELSASS
jgi:hypothetical protein